MRLITAKSIDNLPTRGQGRSALRTFLRIMDIHNGMLKQQLFIA